MSTRIKRAQTGAGVSSEPFQGFSFPSELLHPSQSQVVRSEDAVSARIRELDSWAEKLGSGFGLASRPYALNPVDDLALKSDLANAFAMMLSREERVVLERRGGRWGLYFTRLAALVGQQQNSETVSLRDAPLDVREKFLLKSEDFFQKYLEQCKFRLGNMKESVQAANKTLSMLDNLRLD